jgi:hypothetical protein
MLAIMNPLEFQELVAALEAVPDIVTARIINLSEDHHRWKDSAEEFSALESVCHLRDLEVEGYMTRISRMLDEDHPSLPDFDGTRVAAERDYNSQNLHHAIAAFRDARIANVTMLRKLSPDQLERTATLEGTGTITLAQLVAMMCEHDAGHLDDLRIIQQRLTGTDSGRGATATA